MEKSIMDESHGNYEVMGINMGEEKIIEGIPQESLTLQYNRLISILIHDFRTPLATIIGYLDLFAMNRSKKDKSAQYITKARWGSDELSLLCQNVEDSIAIETGNLQADLIKSDIEIIFKRVLQKLQTFFDYFNKKVSYKVIGELRAVKCDEYIVEKVIYNLIYHCLQNIQPKQEIFIEIEQKSACVYIEIKDQGIEIPEVDRQHVFDKFFALRCFKGGRRARGLNLYYAKLGVQLHNGDMWLEKRGKEQVFCFSLPN